MMCTESRRADSTFRGGRFRSQASHGDFTLVFTRAASDTRTQCRFNRASIGASLTSNPRYQQYHVCSQPGARVLVCGASAHAAAVDQTDRVRHGGDHSRRGRQLERDGGREVCDRCRACHSNPAARAPRSLRSHCSPRPPPPTATHFTPPHSIPPEPTPSPQNGLVYTTLRQCMNKVNL